jgi:hypothetical protein
LKQRKTGIDILMGSTAAVQNENIDTAHTVTPAWKGFGIGTSET